MDGRCAAAVRPRGDSGLFMIGFLVRIVIMLAVLGVAGFDAGSVILTNNRVEKTAGLAADEAARVYHAKPDSKAALAAATAIAKAGDCTLAATDFSVSKAGTITLTVRASATTLVVGRIPGTDDLTHPSFTATRPASAK